jgi:hypothetical protein
MLRDLVFDGSALHQEKAKIIGVLDVLLDLPELISQREEFFLEYLSINI